MGKLLMIPYRILLCFLSFFFFLVFLELSMYEWASDFISGVFLDSIFWLGYANYENWAFAILHCREARPIMVIIERKRVLFGFFVFPLLFRFVCFHIMRFFYGFAFQWWTARQLM